MSVSRRGFLASLLATLAALFAPQPQARAAGAPRRRRQPGTKTRWIGHY